MTSTPELINELGSLSYIGIWFVAVLSNIVIPVPEEVILLAFGYMAAGRMFDGHLLYPIVVSGLLLSDIAMYFFSKRGNKLISAFYDKVFKKRVESRRAWIDRHINKVVFFSRFLVQLRFLGPFFAGQTKMSFRRFFMLDFLAIVLYTGIYMLIGFYFRSRINYIISGVNAVRNIIITVVIIALLIALVRFIRNKLMKIKTDVPTQE